MTYQNVSAVHILGVVREGATQLNPWHTLIKEVPKVHPIYEASHADRGIVRTMIYDASGEVLSLPVTRISHIGSVVPLHVDSPGVPTHYYRVVLSDVEMASIHFHAPDMHLPVMYSLWHMPRGKLAPKVVVNRMALMTEESACLDWWGYPHPEMCPLVFPSTVEWRKLYQVYLLQCPATFSAAYYLQGAYSKRALGALNEKLEEVQDQISQAISPDVLKMVSYAQSLQMLSYGQACRGDLHTLRGILNGWTLDSASLGRLPAELWQAFIFGAEGDFTALTAWVHQQVVTLEQMGTSVYRGV